MTIALTREQEQGIHQLAAASDRSPEALVQDAVDSYLLHSQMLAEAVREGEESADREGWISSEDVLARLQRRFAKSS